MFLLADLIQKWKYEHVRCRIQGGDDINYVCTILDEGFNSRRWLPVGGMYGLRSERSVLRFWGSSQSMEGLSLSQSMKTLGASVLLFSPLVPEGIQVLWPPSFSLTHTPQSFPYSHIMSSCYKYFTVKEKDLP